MMTAARLPIAVLISGGGTTLKNLIAHSARGLPIDIRAVISSNRSAGGLAIADSAGISTSVLPRKDFATAEAYREAVFGACRAAEVQLVVMGGFLKHLLIPSDFAGRVINIHPSLIPDFCGAGFYGERVHRAVLDAGVRQSGCTVHVVDDEYDHGPIVMQSVVAVLPDDTTATLAARVFEAECELLPKVIRGVAEGSIRLEANAVHVD